MSDMAAPIHDILPNSGSQTRDPNSRYLILTAMQKTHRTLQTNEFGYVTSTRPVGANSNFFDL
jgi:hypothetical protein